MAIHIDTDGNFWFGQTGTEELDEISYTPVFSVTNAGVLTATSGTVGGWTLGSDYLRAGNSSNQYIYLNADGSISGNFTSGSLGWSIFADGSAEFNNVTVRGTLDGPNLTGTLTGGTSGSIRVGDTGDELRIIEDSTSGGFLAFYNGGYNVATVSYDGSSLFEINTGRNSSSTFADLALNSGGGDLYLLADNIRLKDNPMGIGSGSNAPVLWLWNGSAYERGQNNVLGTDSNGNLEWTTVASSPVTSISGAGEITVTESSGAYTIEHADSDHNGSFASATDYLNHVGNSTAHGTFDNYGSWTAKAGGNNMTVQSGNGVEWVAGSGLSMSVNTNPYTITLSHGSGTHVSSSTAVQAIYPGGLRGNVTFSTSSGGRFLDYLGQSGQTLNIYTTNYAGTTIYTQDLYPDSNGDEDIGNNFGNGRYRSIFLVNAPSYTSDERLKNTIEDIPYGIDYLNTLRPVQYEWNRRTRPGCITSNYVFQTKTDGETLETECPDCVENEIACVVGEIDTTGVPEGQKSWGFIAQEVLNTPPETDLDIALVDYNETSDEYALRGTELLAPLVKAVQELSTQISELTARVEALEG